MYDIGGSKEEERELSLHTIKGLKGGVDGLNTFFFFFLIPQVNPPYILFCERKRDL